MMRQENIYVIVSSAIIFFIAYLIQLNIFFNGDVGYLSQMTYRLFNGGKYVSDFFETNPPMILYLYAPAVLLSKKFALALPQTMQYYFFLLALLSIVSCYFLLKKIFDENQFFLFCINFFTILFFELILPMSEFGQREHLLILFILPYLLSTVLYLQNNSLPYPLRFVLAFVAGLGFALKPFFLVTFILIESYVLFEEKFKNLWRLESVIIVFLLCVYCFSIFIFHSNYIDFILPLLSQLYFIGIKEPLIYAFIRGYVNFCLSGLFISICFYIKAKRKDYYGMIMILASAGLISAFFIPRAPWLYHVMPALSLVCLSLCYFVGKWLYIDFFQAREEAQKTKFNISCSMFVNHFLCSYHVMHIKYLFFD